MLLLLIPGGCEHRAELPRVESDYHWATVLLHSERWEDAGMEIRKGIQSAPGGSTLAWDFRLLQVELLLARKESNLAATLLESDCPPDAPTFSEERMMHSLHLAESAAMQTETAFQHLEDAQQRADQLHNARGLALIELQRGRWANRAGQYDDARGHFLRVLDYATSHSDDYLRVKASGNMGFLLQGMARHRDAVDWFMKALTESRRLGAKISEARTMGNLGFSFFELGDVEKARFYLSRAEAAFAELNIPAERHVFLGDLGNVEESEHHLDAAVRDYRTALDISQTLGDQRHTAMWSQNLAVVSIEGGDWEAAEKYNQQALRSETEQDRPASQVVQGYISLHKQDYRTAEQIFKNVIRVGAPDVTPVLDAHSGLAQTYAAIQRGGDANAEFQLAIRLLSKHQADFRDDHDKLTWFGSRMRRFYQEYVAFLMSRGRADEALEVAASSRGRVLASRLRESGPYHQQTVSELETMAARSDTTMLVYWLAPMNSYGWAISRNETHSFQLPAMDKLQEKVDEYDEFIQKRHNPMREPSASGEMLFKTLILPAKVKTEKVLLAPDGPLYKLNFATLPVHSAAKQHYWLDDVQIAIAPSFDLAHPAFPVRKPLLLLIGNPAISDPDFPELASAGEEMKNIEESLPNFKPAVFTRNEATPEAYLDSRPEQFSLIHFVSHATANQQEPLESAVILSRGKAGYRLFASDVLKIPLHADLVTISACQSAGAKTYAGEGLVGFSWAFLKTGARNVIAGLWNVDDRSTPSLMADMYKELAKGVRPAQALRTAQLAMLHEGGGFAKPYYWGPFEIFSAVAE